MHFLNYKNVYFLFQSLPLFQGEHGFLHVHLSLTTMYVFNMFFQVTRLREFLWTVWTGMWFLPCMGVFVPFKVIVV